MYQVDGNISQQIRNTPYHLKTRPPHSVVQTSLRPVEGEGHKCYLKEGKCIALMTSSICSSDTAERRGRTSE
jgi:hypothetical protein